MNELTYKIGDHIVQLSIPTTFHLENYEPFRQEHCDTTPLFHMVVSEALTEKEISLIGKFDDDVASITVFYIGDGGYRFHIAPPRGAECAIMDINASFNHATAVLKGGTLSKEYGLNNCLMILYALSSALNNTILVHASVVSYHERAFLFLGKSGTGKSTHSRLWLDHIEGSKLLNDDNPAIRLFPNGKVIVYGTPWSGKTACYINKQFPAGAIVRLRQAPANKITNNGNAQAFASLLSSCSTLSWDKKIHGAICDTIASVVEKTNCYTLDCLPDKAAANLCMQTIYAV